MAFMRNILWKNAPCMGAVLAILLTFVAATCKEDLDPVSTPLKLTLQENTPKDTILLNITNGDSLSISDDGAAYFKVEDGKLMTSIDFFMDGEENKALCDEVKSKFVFLTSLKCKDEGKFSNIEKLLIVTFNYTEDHPTTLNLQQVAVREQAQGVQVVDWRSENNRRLVVKDDDCNSKVSLTVIEDDDTKKYFTVGINPLISAVKALDYETRKSHILNVTASAAIQNGKSVPVHGQLVVNVEDVDDRDPIFDTNVFNLDLAENGEDVHQTANGPPIRARDGDIGINATLEYSIVSSEPALNASISDDGELVIVGGPIDRETTPLYKIIVKAQQVDNPSASATATVFLTITDVNDNRPAFAGQQEQTASILEGAPAGTHVTWLLAADADEGENATFVYTIYENSGAFKLRTIPVTGQTELVVKDSTLLNGLDSTEVQIRLIEKSAVAGGEACDFVTSCAVNITVTIVDINDNTPVFSQPRYPLDVYDDQEVGKVIGQITATDKDKGQNAEIQYSLSKISSEGSPDCDKVQVDQSTGELTLNLGMLAGVTCFYSATACDNPIDATDRRCSTAVVIVTVKSNDTNSKTEVTQYEAHVAEGLDVGSIVMTLPISDLVTNNTNFRIKDGLLESATVLDREEQDTYIVSAGRRNGAEFVEVLRITVHVVNVNDNPPAFLGVNDEIRLMDEDETGLIVLNVSATDADEPFDNVTFSLLNMKEIFTIDATTGQISLALPATEAALTLGASTKQGNSVLLVQASDSGVPPFTTTIRVKVYFPPTNETASVLVPVSKDKLIDDRPEVESKLTEMLGVSVQVLGIESIGGLQDLGSKVFLKSDAQGDQEISSEELKRLIEEHQEAIYDAFAEKYNKAGDGDNSGNPVNVSDDDDDYELSVLAITLICLLILFFIIILILAFAYYQMQKRYRGELSLLQKLNKNTSIYDRAPLYHEASSTTNGTVQGTALNQNGSPRRPSVSLVAYTNDAYEADEAEHDPTYSNIREVPGTTEHSHSNGQSTRSVTNTEGPNTEEAARPGGLSAIPRSGNGNTAGSAPGGEGEEPIYSYQRSSMSSNTNPGFRTTIDVVYPRNETSNDTTGSVEYARVERPRSHDPSGNIPGIENDSSYVNWSLRRNSRLELEHSPANSNSRDRRADFDDVDSSMVSPVSSTYRHGSMKAGSESDSGLPSDRDLRLDDETDPETTLPQPGSGNRNSPLYPNLYPSHHSGNERAKPTPSKRYANERSFQPTDTDIFPEPEPDYEKKVRFDEAKRRSEMVELPRPESLSHDSEPANRDSEITAL